MIAFSKQLWEVLPGRKKPRELGDVSPRVWGRLQFKQRLKDETLLAGTKGTIANQRGKDVEHKARDIRQPKSVEYEKKQTFPIP